jgi:GH25 family lysozyme M1 (1,4-beta-N-acetylmuramidase)
VARLQALGTQFSASYWPITSFGPLLVFPKLANLAVDDADRVRDERLITLPTRGVYADARLGDCNVSELIDNTRFWDWQTSPIPFRAPQIAGVHPESEKQPVTGVAPTGFPTPIVSIQNAPAAPDPATAAALQAITKPDIFRDMSIAKEVAGVVHDVTQAAKEVAIAAGSLAAKTADTGDAKGGGSSGGGGGGGSTGGSPGGAPSGGGAGKGASTGTQQGGFAATPADIQDRLQVLRGMAPEVGDETVKAGAQTLADQLVNASWQVKSSGPTSPPGSLWVEGVDVSYAQGVIDWPTLASSRYEFAYIKATEGSIVTDSAFAKNWAAAGAAGMPRGAYHFFHCPVNATEQQIIDQAKHFATVVGTIDAADLPPMVDVEQGSMPFNKPDPKDARTWSQLVSAGDFLHALDLFLSTVAQLTGRQPVIYTSPGLWVSYLGNSTRFATGYHLWVAQYLGAKGSYGGQDTYAVPSAAAVVAGPIRFGGWAAWSIWQYANTLGVPGCTVQVDRNLVYLPIGLSVREYLDGPPPGTPAAAGVTI